MKITAIICRKMENQRGDIGRGVQRCRPIRGASHAGAGDASMRRGGSL